MTLSISIEGDGMRYLYRRGHGVDRRVMHIARFTKTGQMTGKALCAIEYPFNANINAPFGLGRPICKNCRRAIEAETPTRLREALTELT